MADNLVWVVREDLEDRRDTVVKEDLVIHGQLKIMITNKHIIQILAVLLELADIMVMKGI